MDPDQKQFFSLMVLPACLSQQQTAWYLGFQLHNIPRLIEAGVITPLGHPECNSMKHFALVDLERLRTDAKRLSRATDAVQAGWKRKNRNRAASRHPQIKGNPCNGQTQQNNPPSHGKTLSSGRSSSTCQPEQIRTNNTPSDDEHE